MAHALVLARRHARMRPHLAPKRRHESVDTATEGAQRMLPNVSGNTVWHACLAVAGVLLGCSRHAIADSGTPEDRWQPLRTGRGLQELPICPPPGCPICTAVAWRGRARETIVARKQRTDCVFHEAASRRNRRIHQRDVGGLDVTQELLACA